MKKILLLTLSLLGFHRKKATTKLGRSVRLLERVLNILVLLYVLVHVFPQPLFSHQIEHDGVRLYSRQSFPDGTEALLSRVQAQLRTSELYRGDKTFSIFLCNNKHFYTFFAPFSRYGFGISSFLGNTFLANVDLEKNRSASYRSVFNERTFVGVVSHEIGHLMIIQECGVWAATRMPTWLNEGYCECIAQESSFPEAEGDLLIAQGKEVEDPSFRYFEYRRIVEYCLTEDEGSLNDLFTNPPAESALRSKTQEWISSRISAQ